MSARAQFNGQQTTQDVIQYEVDDGVATIWLNRPEVKNCVNWALLTELGAALERAEDDDDVRVVLIRGRGNTFCAGADLNMLDSEFLGTTNNSVKIAQVSARTFDRAFNLGKPTVAVVEGYAVAGGFELMISCDFAITSDDAKVGDFHIRRALFVGAGRGSRPGRRRLRGADEGQERVHHAHHQARRQPRPRRRHRDADRAGEH